MILDKNIYEFDPLIYPRNLYVTIEADIDEVLNKFEISDSDKNDLDRLSDNDDSFAVKVIDKKTMNQGILVSLNANITITTKTIAHESVHVADYIFEEIGAYSQEFSERNEAYAYLVGWAADCMDNVKTIFYKDQLHGK